ncbi:MAG TPA: DNA polymerase [Balneola sp.]|nr:DNA polymerase [Balneola sp.]|tara:strand:- start:1162 stop:1542 length:381 start_codon:yes stop_codon:yes gene_type:complete
MQLKDFLNSINDNKKNLITDNKSEKLYTPFIVNRCLSYFTDTILYANEMNRNAHVDNKLQYDYFLNSVRKRKRFSRWMKQESSDDLEFIKEHFDYSNKKAKEAIEVLGKEGIKALKENYSRGGKGG